jgi:hypothetical protein
MSFRWGGLHTGAMSTGRIFTTTQLRETQLGTIHACPELLTVRHVQGEYFSRIC